MMKGGTSACTLEIGGSSTADMTSKWVTGGVSDSWSHPFQFNSESWTLFAKSKWMDFKALVWTTGNR